MSHLLDLVVLNVLSSEGLDVEINLCNFSQARSVEEVSIALNFVAVPKSLS
jgi:hypothetical protein